MHGSGAQPPYHDPHSSGFPPQSQFQPLGVPFQGAPPRQQPPPRRHLWIVLSVVAGLVVASLCVVLVIVSVADGDDPQQQYPRNEAKYLSYVRNASVDNMGTNGVAVDGTDEDLLAAGDEVCDRLRDVDNSESLAAGVIAGKYIISLEQGRRIVNSATGYLCVDVRTVE